MRKALIVLVAIAVVAGSVYGYRRYKNTGTKVTVNTAPVTRGDVVQTVGATGTLQAVTTVQVGTQVSGTILTLGADFNSLVKKGQVLARLDPSLFQTQIEQAQANLVRAQADLARLKVTLEDAQTKASRAHELSNRQLIPKSEVDAADVEVRSAQAQIQSSEAQVKQAQASLNQNQVNLQHTVIEAPIDGLVISRNVDVGQTVAASMQAPTLFILAADLTKMQVLANLDESDVGQIRPKQRVTFHVDAYPSEEFVGTVSQVRLQPTVQQNVVTYSTVIDVPNDSLKLKPGMTANVNVEIARSTNVVRIPNSALRFRPTAEMFAALGQTAPEVGGRGEGPGRSARGAAAGNGEGATPSAAASPSSSPAGATATDAHAAASTHAAAASGADKTPAAAPAAPADGAAAGDSRGGGRRGDLAARMQNMTAEERDQMIARMRARGVDTSRFEHPEAGAAAAAGRGTDGKGRTGAAPAGGRGAAPGGRDTAPAPESGLAAEAQRAGGATTIDALFGPLPRQETTGRAWLYTDKQLHPLRLRLGISDGQNTEVIQGDVQAGAEVVTNVSTGNDTRPAATAFPFGQPQRGGFPGGNQGGNRGGGTGAARGGGR